MALQLTELVYQQVLQLQEDRKLREELLLRAVMVQALQVATVMAEALQMVVWMDLCMDPAVLVATEAQVDGMAVAVAAHSPGEMIMLPEAAQAIMAAVAAVVMVVPVVAALHT